MVKHTASPAAAYATRSVESLNCADPTGFIIVVVVDDEPRDSNGGRIREVEELPCPCPDGHSRSRLRCCGERAKQAAVCCVYAPQFGRVRGNQDRVRIGSTCHL